MRVMHTLRRALTLISTPGFVKAILTWKRFSVTSFIMISRLNRQGVAPESVIDIGANVGQFSVASLNIWKPAQHIAIEPFADSYKKLVGVLDGYKNVDTYMCAIGDVAGKLPLNVSGHSHSSSLLDQEQIHEQAFPEAKVAGKIEVEVKTLDQIMCEHQFTRPLLLKIDVQGYEMKVLKGSEEALKITDYILLEVSMRPMYKGESSFSDIYLFLERAGFEFARPIDFLEDTRTGEVLQMDCLFCRKTMPEKE